MCVCPLIDETNCTGENQVATINISLEQLNLTWDNITIVEADHTNVNPKIARLVSKPFIGCKSHLLALAVKKFLEGNATVQRCHELMTKLNNLKWRGHLRAEGTGLKPFTLGHKWGATYNMIHGVR